MDPDGIAALLHWADQNKQWLVPGGGASIVAGIAGVIGYLRRRRTKPMATDSSAVPTGNVTISDRATGLSNFTAHAPFTVNVNHGAEGKAQSALVRPRLEDILRYDRKTARVIEEVQPAPPPPKEIIIFGSERSGPGRILWLLLIVALTGAVALWFLSR